MKPEKINMIECTMISGRQRGVSLLEVLVAIVVFAIGLLAIASLQGNLLRSGSEAKARSVGSSLAMDFLEEVRAFVTDADFEDIIVDRTELITESGVEFQRQAEVLGYRYDRATGTLVECTGTEPCAADPSLVDAKRISVTVSWCDAQSGAGCDPAVLDPADAELEPHTVVIEDIVARANSPVGSARALTQLTPRQPPRVPYNPGEAPSTISIDLGDGSKRESPQPTLETTRGGSTESEAEKVNTVTRLESITYNTLGDGAVNVQRQEFLAANCTCQTGPPGDLTQEEEYVGRTPIFWDGNDWIGRIKVDDKPVGHFPEESSLGNQLNVLCSDCCRDHHDGGSTTTFDHDGDPDTAEIPVAKFNPFRDFDRTGDHDHFDGALSEPVTSGSYLEACRFARVDGLLQLTTDLRLESLQVLPGTTDPASSREPFEDWIQDYRAYVKDFVEIYATEVATGTVDYPGVQPQQDDPDTVEECDGSLPCGDEEAYGTFRNNEPSPKDGDPDPGLPSFDDTPSTETRQLVARAIYLDYLHPILVDRINCRLGNLDPDTNDNCHGGDPDVSGDGRDEDGEPLLPILPFVEVNVALQANWAVVGDDLVQVTDEPVEPTGTTYSRGVVELNNALAADSDVVASIEQGNVGLTDTHDVTPFDCTDRSRLIIDRLTYEGEGSTTDRLTVSGCLNISAELIEGDVIAPSDIDVVDAFGNDCGTTLGDNFFECGIKNLAVDDGTNTIVVSNYGSNQTNVKVCLGPLADGSFEGGTVTDDGRKSEFTTFDFGLNDQNHELDMIFFDSNASDRACPPGQL